jgi:hypothetical protein
MNTKIKEIMEEIESIYEAKCEKEETSELTELVETYGYKAVACYVWNHHSKLDEVEDWVDSFNESYIEEIEIEDYVEMLLEEGIFGTVPEQLYYYIDKEKLCRDLLVEGYWAEEGQLFRSY